jgi:hypothetical protein
MEAGLDPDLLDELGVALRTAAAAALADTDAVGATGADRTIVLTALLSARLSGSVVNAASSPSAEAPTVQTVNPSTIATNDVIGSIALAMAIEGELLDLVYDVRDREPHIVISAKRLSDNKSLATRQLAQLLAAGRQAAGVEEWTSVNTIRGVVQDYGRLDSNNFASSIQQMDKVCLTRGKGVSREIKVTRPGIESTAELIRSLIGNAA